MIRCGTWPVGVCSWSLRGEARETVRTMTELGVSHVHLALGPALGSEGDAYVEAFRGAGLVLTCGMIDFPQEDYTTLTSIRRTGGIVPDEEWAGNRARFLAAVELARRIGVGQLSMHAGFLDAADPARAGMLRDRLRELADAAGAAGLQLLLETGQETADEMAEFLAALEHPAVGINFDPANMILYGKGNPVMALAHLAPWVRHVHIKDAVAATRPGEWGTEVPWGTGWVGDGAFLRELKAIGFDGALAVEREAGDDRLGDIRRALERLSGTK